MSMGRFRDALSRLRERLFGPKKNKYEVVVHKEYIRKGKSRKGEMDTFELRTIVEARNAEEAAIAGLAKMANRIEPAYHEFLDKIETFGEVPSVSRMSDDSEIGEVHLYRNTRDGIKETKSW